MTTPIQRLLPLYASVAMATSLLAGCGTAKNNDQADVPLTGFVKDASGTAVPNAKVANAAGTLSATTDAEGHFSFTVPTAAVGEGALSASAPNYSTAYRIVPVQSPNQDFVLRRFDTETMVTLPTDTSTTASATATRGDGKVTLSIPFGSLTTPTGALATGEATVRLTYWHPIADANHIPTPLVAHLPKGSDGNGPYDLPLQTVGMVDVQVTQGNDVLQVTPGQNLGLEHAVPAAIAAAMAQKPNDMANPYLFYFDTATSRWLLDGSISWDGNTGIMRGELPHLTIWNYDNFENWNPPSTCSMSDIRDSKNGCNKPQDSSVGGCMSGTALKKDGSPYANSTVRLWLFDNEQISAVDVPTSASGQYCANIGTRLCVPSGGESVKCDYTTNTINYLVSGTDSSNDSSMANPIPANCQGAGGPYGAVTQVNSCGMIDDPDTGAKAKVQPASTPALANITAYTFCSNPSSCAQIPDTTISSDVSKTPTSKTPAAQCLDYISVGKACTISPDPVSKKCCASGSYCSDYICVPHGTGSITNSN